MNQYCANPPMTRDSTSPPCGANNTNFERSSVTLQGSSDTEWNEHSPRHLLSTDDNTEDDEHPDQQWAADAVDYSTFDFSDGELPDEGEASTRGSGPDQEVGSQNAVQEHPEQETDDEEGLFTEPPTASIRPGMGQATDPRYQRKGSLILPKTRPIVPRPEVAVVPTGIPGAPVQMVQGQQLKAPVAPVQSAPVQNPVLQAQQAAPMISPQFMSLPRREQEAKIQEARHEQARLHAELPEVFGEELSLPLDPSRAEFPPKARAIMKDFYKALLEAKDKGWRVLNNRSVEADHLNKDGLPERVWLRDNKKLQHIIQANTGKIREAGMEWVVQELTQVPTMSGGFKEVLKDKKIKFNIRRYSAAENGFTPKMWEHLNVNKQTHDPGRAKVKTKTKPQSKTKKQTPAPSSAAGDPSLSAAGQPVPANTNAQAPIRPNRRPRKPKATAPTPAGSQKGQASSMFAGFRQDDHAATTGPLLDTFAVNRNTTAASRRPQVPVYPYVPYPGQAGAPPKPTTAPKGVHGNMQSDLEDPFACDNVLSMQDMSFRQWLNQNGEQPHSQNPVMTCGTQGLLGIDANFMQLQDPTTRQGKDVPYFHTTNDDFDWGASKRAYAATNNGPDSDANLFGLFGETARGEAQLPNLVAAGNDPTGILGVSNVAGAENKFYGSVGMTQEYGGEFAGQHSAESVRNIRGGVYDLTSTPEALTNFSQQPNCLTAEETYDDPNAPGHSANSGRVHDNAFADLANPFVQQMSHRVSNHGPLFPQSLFNTGSSSFTHRRPIVRSVGINSQAPPAVPVNARHYINEGVQRNSTQSNKRAAPDQSFEHMDKRAMSGSEKSSKRQATGHDYSNPRLQHQADAVIQQQGPPRPLAVPVGGGARNGSFRSAAENKKAPTSAGMANGEVLYPVLSQPDRHSEKETDPGPATVPQASAPSIQAPMDGPLSSYARMHKEVSNIGRLPDQPCKDHNAGHASHVFQYSSLSPLCTECTQQQLRLFGEGKMLRCICRDKFREAMNANRCIMCFLAPAYDKVEMAKQKRKKADPNGQVVMHCACGKYPDAVDNVRRCDHCGGIALNPFVGPAGAIAETIPGKAAGDV